LAGFAAAFAFDFVAELPRLDVATAPPAPLTTAPPLPGNVCSHAGCNTSAT
jgi:hypothetical protein